MHAGRRLNMINEIGEILVTEEEINETVNSLAKQIDEAYQGKKLLMIAILKGSVVFMGDLMKHITVPVEIDFMKVSSYGAGTTSSGKITVHLDVQRQDLSNCDVLIVEDIIDSGRTLSFLETYLQEKGARSVKTCTMLDKPSRRVVDYEADFVGKIIPDKFVVGYGLDYNEQFRALPYIGVLKPEVYNR